MAFIEFKNTKKEYKTGDVTITAVDSCSFAIEKGELAVILGPSGAGKTTILNLLGGMDRPNGGIIEVDGREISGYTKKELIYYRRRDIGFVFQFYNLIGNLTALENVELACQLCPNSLDPKEVLRQVGLSDRMNSFPAQLSGGEQQRVALARALVNNPQTIIADEPTGNIDPELSHEIMELLMKINRLGKTVIVITHDRSIVERYKKRVITISDGVITSDKIGGYFTDEDA